MLAWEEQTEQCMVSTKVDGIDNGDVEDVFVYRASYSLLRLVQTLGRIRPHRQSFHFGTLNILDTGYYLSRTGEVERQLNNIKARHIVPSNTDDNTVRDFYLNVFNIYGYQNFVSNSDRCYRKLLFSYCGIKSSVCRNCSN